MVAVEADMNAPFLSPSWHRLADIRPRLRADVEVSRQRYAGRVWYALHDPVAAATHRVTLAAYLFVGRLDGRRTVNEIYEEMAADPAAPPLGQGDVVKLLTQLHANELIASDAAPDAVALEEARRRRGLSQLLLKLRSPLTMKAPLFNPARFLDATAWAFTPLFTPLGGLVWLAIVVAGGVTALQTRVEITQNLSDRLLSLENVALLAGAWLVVKTAHELGHAYAVRAYGGEVRELGVMALVLMPAPYVDASAANAFRSKWRRASVAATGVAVELLLAALAAMTWARIEAGFTRALLYDVMLIGGLSTVIFNGNPLMRFDGYYVLCDIAETPNLAQRSNAAWARFAERRLLGLPHPPSPPTRLGEAVMLALYAPASWAYRVIVMLGLGLLLSRQFFVFGVALGIWAVGAGVAWPIVRFVAEVVAGPRLRLRRARALTLGLAGLAAAVWSIGFVPAPNHAATEGVVWLPSGSSVKAGADGFIARIAAEPGAKVRVGDLLVEIDDPAWRAEIAADRARIEEYQARYRAARVDDPPGAETVALELERARSELARAEERARTASARSERDGVFVFPAPVDALGRFSRQGAVLGYVAPYATRTLRVLVAQGDIDLVRRRVEKVEVRLADWPDRTFAAQLVREVPEAATDLPSRAFGAAGGGDFLSDPRDPKGMKALQRTFQFDVELAEDAEPMMFGARAHVRFDFKREPLGVQIYRRLRQLFLARLDV